MGTCPQTHSVKSGVSYFRLLETANRPKLVPLWQSRGLSHRWTDEYSLLAACMWFPLLQGITDTEINASCFVEGNKVERYY